MIIVVGTSKRTKLVSSRIRPIFLIDVQTLEESEYCRERRTSRQQARRKFLVDLKMTSGFLGVVLLLLLPFSLHKVSSANTFLTYKFIVTIEIEESILRKSAERNNSSTTEKTNSTKPCVSFNCY